MLIRELLVLNEGAVKRAIEDVIEYAVNHAPIGKRSYEDSIQIMVDFAKKRDFQNVLSGCSDAEIEEYIRNAYDKEDHLSESSIIKNDVINDREWYEYDIETGKILNVWFPAKFNAAVKGKTFATGGRSKVMLGTAAKLAKAKMVKDETARAGFKFVFEDAENFLDIDNLQEDVEDSDLLATYKLEVVLDIPATGAKAAAEELLKKYPKAKIRSIVRDGLKSQFKY